MLGTGPVNSNTGGLNAFDDAPAGGSGQVAWTQTPDALEVTIDGEVGPDSGPVVKVWLAPERPTERTDALHG